MEQKKPTEAKVVVIDGQRTMYHPVPSILPPSMAVLLRVLRNTKVLTTPRFGGYRPDCGEGSHRLIGWLRGFYGLRELLIERCLDCEMAAVRDISFDRINGLPTGRLALRRKSDLLGWYTGSRANRRVYL